MPLSKIQQAIFNLLTKENYTPKQIATRRGTTIQAVYKIIKLLQKKGYLLGSLERFNLKGVATQGLTVFGDTNFHKIRVHAQHFEVKILGFSRKYYLTLEKCNQLVILNSTVRLYKTSLSIYINESFFGDSVKEAVGFSCDYISKILMRLENRLKLILIKSEYTNVKQVRCHVSEIKNGLAQDCNVKHIKLLFRADEDNKVYLIVDNSFNLDELETVHPVTAIDDMNVIKPVFDDIRKFPDTPVRSEHYKVTLELSKAIKSLGDICFTQSKQIGEISVILSKLVNPYQSDGKVIVKEDKSNADYFG